MHPQVLLPIPHEKTALKERFFHGARADQLLNKKFITSPSLTT
jgi:hypothetical protein